MEETPVTLVLAATHGILVPYHHSPVPYTELTEEQRKIVDEFKSTKRDQHGVIHGTAGTGKTTAIVHLCKQNVKTLTIKRCMGGDSIGLVRSSNALFLDGIKASNIARLVLENAWMIDVDMITKIHEWFCLARGNMEYPFGGIPQVLFVGDWLSTRKHGRFFKSSFCKQMTCKHVTLETTLRWNPVDQDEFHVLVQRLRQLIDDKTQSGLPEYTAQFIEHIMMRPMPHTTKGAIQLTTGSDAMSAQWKAYDTNKYTADFTFVPRVTIAGADPRNTEGAFPVVIGMPIVFIYDVVNPDNTSQIVIPKGEVARLHSVKHEDDSPVPHRPSPRTKNILITIKRISVPGNPLIQLPATPYLIREVKQPAAKRARRDNVPKFVPSSRWCFQPAWILKIQKTYNLTLDTHLFIHVHPLEHDNYIQLRLLYTALTRGCLCTQIRTKQNLCELFYEKPQGPPVQEEEEEAAYV